MGKRPRQEQREGAPLGRDLPWLEAIQRVLAQAPGALSPTDIAERIISSGLRRQGGATPAQTVASNLSTSLREQETSFIKVDRGLYTVKTKIHSPPPSEHESQSEANAQSETGALRAFGMFWRRESFLWSGDAKLLARQGTGASNVNFADQIGVYLLHDRDRVIYIGRASDALYSRLRAHTSDRLSGRWGRFSWFGLKGVSDNGTLIDQNVPWTQGVVIETMEALLIESLEPPLNRKRGDNFSAVEFVQVIDPQIERRQKKALLDELSNKL